MKIPEETAKEVMRASAARENHSSAILPPLAGIRSANTEESPERFSRAQFSDVLGKCSKYRGGIYRAKDPGRTRQASDSRGKRVGERCGGNFAGIPFPLNFSARAEIRLSLTGKVNVVAPNRYTRPRVAGILDRVRNAVLESLPGMHYRGIQIRMLGVSCVFSIG